MKQIKQLTVHPGLGNDLRMEVIDWCVKCWGDYHDEDSKWWTTSNYNRTDNGTFDVIFNDVKLAEIFILRWNGTVCDIEYDKSSCADPEVLDRLFY